jgi:hypothetical protein
MVQQKEAKDAKDERISAAVSPGGRVLRLLFLALVACSISAVVYQNDYPFEKVAWGRTFAWAMFISFNLLPLAGLVFVKTDKRLSVIAIIVFVLVFWLGPLK